MQKKKIPVSMPPTFFEYSILDVLRERGLFKYFPVSDLSHSFDNNTLEKLLNQESGDLGEDIRSRFKERHVLIQDKTLKLNDLNLNVGQALRVFNILISDDDDYSEFKKIEPIEIDTVDLSGNAFEINGNEYRPAGFINMLKAKNSDITVIW